MIGRREFLKKAAVLLGLTLFTHPLAGRKVERRKEDENLGGYILPSEVQEKLLKRLNENKVIRGNPVTIGLPSATWSTTDGGLTHIIWEAGDAAAFDAKLVVKRGELTPGRHDSPDRG